MTTSHNDEIILGIDLGPNSLGWALIETQNKRPVRLKAAGVRVFQAGLDKLESTGRGQSRSVERRMARLMRRQYKRRSRRRGKLARLLQWKGLLPDRPLRTGEERHACFTELDKTLETPYRLRARALDQRLEPFELGRAFCHLGQRRGFLSNRKINQKGGKDSKVVEPAINELEEKIAAAGARTLGEYFAAIDTHKERIRGHYTSRKKMCEVEFEKIWAAQKVHYPDILTDEFKEQVHRVIFHQRPIKSQRHLIGMCELEPGRRRAPWALLSAQRFRYLQKLNDLRIRIDGRERSLTSVERNILLEHIEFNADLKFNKMRRLLHLPDESVFNLETPGETGIVGNKTAATLAKIFERNKIFERKWKEMDEVDRQAVVEDMLSIQKDEALKRRGIKHWKLEDKVAEEFSRTALEKGYCSLSRRALTKLLPLLEEGQPLETAIRQTYPGKWQEKPKPIDFLPRPQELRNPIVVRALSELRKVVNSIIRVHGKPHLMRIELGRDLRQSAKQREAAQKMMQKNRTKREHAKKILEEAGIANPTSDDILKALLHEECGGFCPYTGKCIPFNSLFGDYPQFDVEHIIPLSRSLDNSFLNKTLCHTGENRKKNNRTPYEAYFGTDMWNDVIAHVKNFRGDSKQEKLRRFLLTPEGIDDLFNNFTNRQLNDMRYASRKAREYLGLLYGCNADGVDSSDKIRIQTSAGQITAFLRNAWDLNSILNDGPGKSRDDHRHHAIDAVIVALTDAKTIKLLSEAARRAAHERRRLFGKVDQPWEGFRDEVDKVIGNIVASHRISLRVRGALHKETLYSPPKKENDGGTYVYVRKALHELTRKQIENKVIVDHAVLGKIREKLEELGGDIKKFNDRINHPSLRGIPIHRVRIREKIDTPILQVGEGHRIRYAKSGNNHHIELFEIESTGRWDGVVVTMREAYLRKEVQRRERQQKDVHHHFSAAKSIICQDHGPGKKFLFPLACGEIVEMDTDRGKREMYVVTSIPQTTKKIEFVPINDARKQKDARISARPETLRIRNCRKVTVSPLGEVRHAYGRAHR